MTHTAHPIEENADALVDRMLRLLRSKMQEKGMSQLTVQESLGWGRTYISQLFRKQKALRVDQVLMILDTLGVETQDFFAELFGTPTQPRVDPPTAQDRELLTQIISRTHEAHHKSSDTTPRGPAQRQQEDQQVCHEGVCNEGVCHKEFSATIRALVYFAATLGKAPVDHFVGIYRRELRRDGLLQEGEDQEGQRSTRRDGSAIH